MRLNNSLAIFFDWFYGGRENLDGATN